MWKINFILNPLYFKQNFAVVASLIINLSFLFIKFVQHIINSLIYLPCYLLN